MSGACQEAVENGSVTEVITETVAQQPSTSEHLVLHLQSHEAPPRIRWSEDTVDNEGMGKKKSKCCCIYKKKRNWDESDSSDSECETGHCRGHVEKHQKPGKDQGECPEDAKKEST
ncbi:protein phosphatase inhibitor domain-containing protein [Ditylenchus destructor]|nr:protein phosphatase inhibitor domain-containing protein [Ditylenchus destructor]